MNNLSPLILFVYNRPSHTGQTLNALMQNELASQSVLYIYADGPKQNAKEDQLQNICAVRQLIRSKKWCKEVHIIESENNKGLAGSVISGVTDIINKYGKAIVLEDDIVTSNQFLSFMNEALNYYESKEIVFGISGYTYPSKFPITGTHFLPIGSSWGWATWKSRWSLVSFNAAALQKEIIAQKKKIQFDFGNCPYFNMLQEEIDGKINSWAIRFYASMFLQDKLFLYPGVSLVNNIGFDNTATHTSVPDNFFDKVATGDIQFHFSEPVTDQNTENIRTTFAGQFKVTNVSKAPSVISVVRRTFARIKQRFLI